MADSPGLLQLSQSPDARIRLALPLDITRLAARPARLVQLHYRYAVG